MRILHIIHSANPEGGGTIEAVRQLATMHQDVGHRVEVASLDSPDAGWMRDSAVCMHGLGTSPSSYGFTPRLIPWLRQRRTEFDIVVSHGLWQFNGLATRIALQDSGVPFCVFPHGMLDPWFKRRYPLKHLKKWLYWSLCENRVLREAAGVIFTCEEERLQARQTFRPYRCREVVVNFGTAVPRGDGPAQRQKFFLQFPELRGKRILLFLGRVHEKKGCRELMEAFRRTCVSEQGGGAPFHLVFAGPTDNDYARELQRTATLLGLGDQMTWTGMLRGDLKWGAFHAAEAFILPSHQENFGIAVAEALACGVPVLISNKVNIWREIQQDRAGLVENDDLAGTVQLLQRWIALEDQERDALRRRAQDCFTNRFEITRAAHDLLGVFHRLVEQRTNASMVDAMCAGVRK